MTDHYWVKIVITPIQVIDDPEVSSEPVIFSSEADELEAQECLQYGCLKCDETLTQKSLNTPCLSDTPEEIDGIYLGDTSFSKESPPDKP